MSRRPLLLAALIVTLGVALAGPAAAQDWNIYVLGAVEPIVADFYHDGDPPWIVFHFKDDPSMYVFALGCNKVVRVERGGAAVALPACPVEKLPTSMPRVFISIIDLEAKRLDDAIAKLREQTRSYAEAVIGSVAATQGFIETATTRAREMQLARATAAVSFLQSQINDTLFEIRLSDQRVGKLLDAAKSFPPGERQRYFFAPR
jgi:hypothetical protein